MNRPGKGDVMVGSMKLRAADARRGELVHGTTILALRHQGRTVMAGDGQVSFGDTVLKHRARKVRRLYQGAVLAGFAGSGADAFTLFEKFESKLAEHNGNLTRASVELAKDWRTDRVLRRLEALLIAADRQSMFLLSGSGDIVEPDEPVIGIGSGGMYAVAACKALLRHASLPARVVAEEAMKIAASICIYTNDTLAIEELE